MPGTEPGSPPAKHMPQPFELLSRLCEVALTAVDLLSVVIHIPVGLHSGLGLGLPILGPGGMPCLWFGKQRRIV